MDIHRHHDACALCRMVHSPSEVYAVPHDTTDAEGDVCQA